ncbi:MAG: hypothetical protein KatS3mg058_3812 [Roseiflexus sp.]|nr:MAG: hypothetical protein KatS3mg058_3812 [Roseiflexus sp.]
MLFSFIAPSRRERLQEMLLCCRFSVVFDVIPMMIEDAACWSFRALRFAQGKRSEESERVAPDPLRCSG